MLSTGSHNVQYMKLMSLSFFHQALQCGNESYTLSKCFHDSQSITPHCQLNLLLATIYAQHSTYTNSFVIILNYYVLNVVFVNMFCCCILSIFTKWFTINGGSYTILLFESVYFLVEEEEKICWNCVSIHSDIIQHKGFAALHSCKHIVMKLHDCRMWVCQQLQIWTTCKETQTWTTPAVRNYRNHKFARITDFDNLQNLDARGIVNLDNP